MTLTYKSALTDHFQQNQILPLYKIELEWVNSIYFTVFSD